MKMYAHNINPINYISRGEDVKKAIIVYQSHNRSCDNFRAQGILNILISEQRYPITV